MQRAEQIKQMMKPAARPVQQLQEPPDNAIEPIYLLCKYSVLRQGRPKTYKPGRGKGWITLMMKPAAGWVQQFQNTSTI